MSAPTKEREIARCSFCLKPNTEVGKLVSGPGVYICDVCVSLCVGLIEAPTPESAKTQGDSPRRLAPWEQVRSVEEVLAVLPDVAAAGLQVEEHLLEWIRKARSLGASWARVGEALQITRQSAWERFSGEV